MSVEEMQHQLQQALNAAQQAAVQAQTAAAVSTAAAQGSVQLVDTKVLGKPTNFDGADKNYKDWAFSFANWFACLTENASIVLESTVDLDDEVTLDAASLETLQLSKTLYLI